MQSRAENAFVDYLLKTDEGDLYDRRRAIEGLLEHPGWELVQNLIEARIRDTQLQMETGLHEHTTYTAFIGELRGMKISQYAANAVIEAADRREQMDRELAQMAGEER